MKLDSYVRVSRVAGRGGDSFISPEVQEDRARAYADAFGHSIEGVHVDLDRTGGNFKRPGIQEALRRVEAGETDGIIVSDLDRFGRSAIEIHSQLERIKGTGGYFVAVRQGIDTSEKGGWATNFILGIFAAIAQMERERTTENFEVSTARAIARGVHFARRAPFGYTREKGKALVPDPLIAPLVGDVFRRRALRESRPSIAAWLNEACPRADGRQWSARNVATMIANRAYLGEAFHGEHRNPDAHPALVTLPEWEAANAVQGGSGAVTRESALLAGLVRCAGCRYAMRKTWTSYAHGRRALYVCPPSTTRAGGKCPAPAKVMAHLIEPVVMLNVLARIGGARWENTTAEGQGVEEAQRQLDHAEARLRDFLADDELRAIVGREEYLRSAQERQESAEGARAELEQAHRHAHASQRRSHVLFDEWTSMRPEQHAETLRMVLDGVYVKKGRGSIEDRVMILWDGEDSFEKPRRGTTDYKVRPVPWPVVADPEDYLSEHRAGRFAIDSLAWKVPGLARRLGDPLAEEAWVALGGETAVAAGAPSALLEAV